MPADLTPYAGRWVALVGDDVAGVGHTAVAAERAARHQRPRDKFHLQFIQHPGPSLPLPPLLDQLRPLFAQYPDPVYLVGGAIRDALLGQLSNDLDFVLAENAVKLAFHVANALGVPAFVMDKERGTARVVLDNGRGYIDFATFRGTDLTADLLNRDYTINAIALPVAATTLPSLVDPSNGYNDLQNKLIRHVDEHALLSDPIRTLRGVRLALRLGFRILPTTAVAIAEAAPHLAACSGERIRDELVKLLQTDQPADAIAQLDQLQLLPAVWPEIARQHTLTLSPAHTLFDHTLAHLRWLRWLEQLVANEPLSTDDPAVLAVAPELAALLAPYRLGLQAHWQQSFELGVDGRTLLRLAALFHDIGKLDSPLTENGRLHFPHHQPIGADLTTHQLRQLAFSNKSISHVSQIVAGHSRPRELAQSQLPLSRRAIFRYFHVLGSAGLDVALLALADHLATHHGRGPETSWHPLQTVVQQLLMHYFDHYNQTIAPPPLLDGRQLMQALDLPPGPNIGRLLHLIRENQANGDILTQADALAFARRHLGT